MAGGVSTAAGSNRSQRLKQLEEENAKLKRIVAEQATRHHYVEGSGWEEMVSSEAKRSAIAHRQEVHGASDRRACGLIDQPRSTQRYQAKPKPDDDLAKRIAELAAVRPRFDHRKDYV